VKNNTGLYIRRRGSCEEWQLFLGGYTKAKPSALYYNYDKHFRKLYSDYEWVVLERRRSKAGMTAMYQVGDDAAFYGAEPVSVVVDREVPEWENPRFRKKLVECLSVWHTDSDSKVFRGSISNRICPECVEKEYRYFYNKERQ